MNKEHDLNFGIEKRKKKKTLQAKSNREETDYKAQLGKAACVGWRHSPYIKPTVLCGHLGLKGERKKNTVQLIK